MAMGRGRLDWSRQVQVLPFSDHYGIHMNATCQYVIIVKKIERDAHVFFAPTNFQCKLHQVAMRFLLQCHCIVGLCCSNFNLLRNFALRFYLLPPNQLALEKGEAVPNYLATHGIATQHRKQACWWANSPRRPEEKTSDSIVYIVSLFSTWKHTTWLDGYMWYKWD